MSLTLNIEEGLDPFFERGLIVEAVQIVKSGKEATVVCCRAGQSLGGGLVAAKLYRPIRSRSFKNDSVYQEGRVILDRRARRAVASKTEFGQEARFGMWVNHEYETLRDLHKAGVNVPAPLAISASGLLEEYFGDEDEPAPILKRVRLEQNEAAPLFACLLHNIERMLAHNVVHGDLSPFNVLYWQGAVTIIDLPQAVDPRFNRNAFDLLLHDIDQICRYFAAYGLHRDATAIANDLWWRFLNGEL